MTNDNEISSPASPDEVSVELKQVSYQQWPNNIIIQVLRILGVSSPNAR